MRFGAAFAAVVAGIAVGSVPAAAAERYQPLDELDRVAPAPGLQTVEPAPLAGGSADGRSPDFHANPDVPQALQLPGGKASASNHFDDIAAQSREFLDQHQHTLTLSTDNPQLNLSNWASMIAGVYHFGEIEFAHFFITSNVGVARICGPEAIACYAPDDVQTTGAGVIVLSYQDPDIVHSVFHEYGHHIDNQLYNLSWVTDCSFAGDGSRRWFFARDVEDNIFDKTGCDASTAWERLLAELYAEDFAQLNGIRATAFDPRMPVPAPTSRQLNALEEDITDPFIPYRLRFKGRRSGQVHRTFRLSAPAFIDVLKARGVQAAGLRHCGSPLYTDIFEGRCRLSMRTGQASGRFRLTLGVY